MCSDANLEITKVSDWHMCISLTLEFESSLRILFPNLEAVHSPIEIALVTVCDCAALLFRTIPYQCGGCADTYQY